ncbi:MAG: quinoprotein relay system zinc metallohydrolase 2 [Candidatus Thiodiazotropha endolucinida]|nr:quinoprotein relay system zinc metallohydrolase 2 [Candidatus Thiodiazotropha taylori]
MPYHGSFFLQQVEILFLLSLPEMKQVKTTRQYGIFINFRKIYANLLPLDTSLLFQKILKIQYSQTCVMFSLALILLSTSATDVMAGEGFQQIAPGLYFSSGVHQDFSKSNKGQIANTGFIVGSERVAIIDTGSSYHQGVRIREQVRAVTDLPIDYVILTHMHPDHALGTSAFSKDSPLVIGHQNLADALARRESTYLNNMKRLLGDSAKDTRLVIPSKSVTTSEGMSIDLGDRWLYLTAYPTAHTNNDLSVFDTKTGTLWLSDLLFVDRIPVIDGSLLGWLKVMDGLMASGCINTQHNQQCQPIVQVVPGHGPVVTAWQSALAKQHHYLEEIANQIRRIIRKGGTISQAVKSVGLDEQGNWLLFNEYHGRNVTAAFAELEWE